MNPEGGDTIHGVKPKRANLLQILSSWKARMARHQFWWRFGLLDIRLAQERAMNERLTAELAAVRRDYLSFKQIADEYKRTLEASPGWAEAMRKAPS